MIWYFLLSVFVIWGLIKSAQATVDRIKSGDWGRLAIAGVALAVPVVFSLAWGIN